MARRGTQWNGERVRALRHVLGVTQRALAADLGVRQQTVSDWETGVYRPRGASSRLLDIVAERAGLAYSTGDQTDVAAPGDEPAR